MDPAVLTVGGILLTLFTGWISWLSVQVVKILSTLEWLQAHRVDHNESIKDHESRLRILEQP